MTLLTLLAKAYGASQLQQIDEALKLAFEGVAVEAKILGTIADGWVQIAVAGEDEKIATNYLIREIGVCPRSFGGMKKFSTQKGYISNFAVDGKELLVDIGVFEPTAIHAAIPLPRLQAQLTGGRQVALGKIAELFGFCKGLPVHIKVIQLSEEGNYIEAELSSKQVSNYELWRESLLDRLITLGASFNEVKIALAHAKMYRDVIDVESLGLLEHVLTCKLGTDAAGLIPVLGRNLTQASFAIFDAKKNYELLKS
ncbi:MAG: DUF2110 family protein [Candidatus Bathyarchaeota archaeon]|nr:DUF2110 family protein [Candidatus Bathyarchaeota archaeon]